MSLLLLLFAIFSIYAVAADNVNYYVASNNQSCPIGEECHDISYYSNAMFAPVSTLIFMEGQHKLTSPFAIKGLQNLTLIGQGQWIKVSWTMQSTVIIDCAYHYISLSDVQNVSVRNISIVGCDNGIDVQRISNLSVFQVFVDFINLCLSDIKYITVHSSFLKFINSRSTNVKHNVDQLSIFGSTMILYFAPEFDDITYNFQVIEVNNSILTIFDPESSLIFDLGSFFMSDSQIFGLPLSSIVCNTIVLRNITVYGYDGIEITTLSNTTNHFEISDSQVFNTMLALYINHHCIIRNTKISNISNPDKIGKLAALSIYFMTDSIDYSNIISLSNVTILDNNMTGIYIEQNHKHGTVEFVNHSSLIANNKSPQDGGGMWISQTSSVYTEVNVYFINNTARGFGGAAYIDARLHQSFESETSFCITNLHFNFTNNKAEIVGNDIYGGNYVQCHFDNFDVLNDFLQTIDCPDIHDDYLLSHVITSPLGVCLCSDKYVTSCHTRIIPVAAYPGQSIDLSLATVGQCAGFSPSVLIVAKRNNLNVNLMTTSQVTPYNSCKTFTYKLMKEGLDDKGSFVISYEVVNDFILYNSSLLVNVHFLSCPKGLIALADVCECDKAIMNIAHCNIELMPFPINRSGNNWLYYSYTDNCTVGYTNCPFDYCITDNVELNLNNPDVQCTLNRSGILCGRCQEGLSLLLGSNQCGACDTKYISLVVIFVAAGITLIAFLYISDLTISTGRMSGLLYYANIMKLNEPVNGFTLPVLSQFLSWLNLDLGIETCFVEGLDGYWKTWLQFAFPLYIWLLNITIIIGCHYSIRLTHYLGRNSVPVLATLFVMSFTKVLHTIANALMMSRITCNDVQWNVWSVDGSIGYLSSKHIPLFGVSLVLLLGWLLYALGIFCSQWLQYYGGKYCRKFFIFYMKLKPFIDAHTGPYNDKYRYWTGLMLIVRFSITIVFAYTTGFLPQLNNYITIFVCLILLMWVRGVYRNSINGYIEIFFFLNLFLTSLLSATSDSLQWNIKPYINGASIGCAMIVFCAIVLASFVVFLRRKLKCFHKMEEEPLLQAPYDNDDNEDNIDDEYSPARIINRRESLIFDLKLE